MSMLSAIVDLCSLTATLTYTCAKEVPSESRLNFTAVDDSLEIFLGRSAAGGGDETCNLSNYLAQVSFDFKSSRNCCPDGGISTFAKTGGRVICNT